MARRRGHGEGTIKTRKYKRQDGTEATFYQAFPPKTANGARPSLGSFKTRKEAQEALRVAAIEESEGVIVGGKKPLFSEWSTQWLDARTQIGYSTRRAYASSFACVHPYIGNLRIHELTERHLATMWRKLGAGLEPDGKTPRRRGPMARTTLDRVHRHVAAALRGATLGRHRVISHNPARMEEARPPRGEREPIHPLTEPEVMQLFNATRPDREFPLWMFLITTGVRPGEARAVQWSDIDWERRTVSISKSIHDEKGVGPVVGPTKTKKNRVISLRPEMIRVLHAHKARQGEIRLKTGPMWQERDLVFATKFGNHLDPRFMQDSFDRACAAAAVERRKLKETRHTFATLGLLHNVPVKIISEALGHASVAITLDIYSHVIAGLQEDSLAHLDRLLS